jgi:HSP20 family protein
MSVRDLIPWSRTSGRQVPGLLRDDDQDPFLSLHREVNRLFDDVLRGFGSSLPSLSNANTFGGG